MIGDPGIGPVDLLADIPQDVKIGAIWGK